MAIGLQCFDSTGKIILDATEKATFFYGLGYTGTSPGRIKDARINKSTTFIMPYKTLLAEKNSDSFVDDELHNVRGYTTVFEITDGEISWDWKENGGNMNDPYMTFPVTVNWFIYGGVYK